MNDYTRIIPNKIYEMTAIKICQITRVKCYLSMMQDLTAYCYEKNKHLLKETDKR